MSEIILGKNCYKNIAKHKDNANDVVTKIKCVSGKIKYTSTRNSGSIIT